ncbi:MAG TPA: energy transducer TonB [Pyrinomonadaceae bacterium]|nr:energy transducer TonB [Pyrinomonadaceae bacterium]
MKSRRIRAALLTVAGVVCFSTAGSIVMGQSGAPGVWRSADANPDSWKRFVSMEGRFTAVFPGSPKVSEETISSPPLRAVIHKTQFTSLAEYGVIYSDYPKEIVDRTSADVILDQGAQGAVAEVNSQLLSISPITVNGYPGRFLKERMPNGTIMQAKLVLVGQRLFQVAITTPREDGVRPETVGFYNSIAQKFLDSFEIINSNLSAAPAQPVIRDGSCPPDVLNCVGLAEDDLRTRAISLPNPAYPPIARAAHASGTVEVAVVVDEQGQVVSAKSISGHPLLQAAAVSAARYARFTPLSVDDKLVKVSGIIKYDFVLE